jgi:hypothetical protein
VTCTICQNRRAKRYCPALRSHICPQCCGKEREETIDCPLDCPYLIEGREHEKRAGLSPKQFPYKEIAITEQFLRQHEELLNALGAFVLHSALRARGAADQDVREALDALVRTYKSLESGIYYNTMPQSLTAQNIVSKVQESLKKFRLEEAERAGIPRTRDADVLGILIFLLRMAIDRDNGRRRGRSFIGFLQRHFTPAEPAPAPSSLILPA